MMTRPSSSLLSLLPGHLRCRKTSQWLWHFSVNWHVEFGQKLEIDNGETTCLWALQSLLAKVEVFGTQVFSSIRWNLFVETNYQITFTSMNLPKTMNHEWKIHTLLYIFFFQKYNHTQKVNTQDNFNANFNQKMHFLEQSLMKVHAVPPFWKWSFPFSSCREGILFLDTHI